MKSEQINKKLIDIKERMASAPGGENMRTLISTHLTKVLMLYGRLHSDYNPRYLPVTINSILLLADELEMIEKNYKGFSEIFSENIERREKYSNVFLIPSVLKENPTANGLRVAMNELAGPLLKNYCVEDHNFLSTLSQQVTIKTRKTLFLRTKRNCDLLEDCCSDEDRDTLEGLRSWCKSELKRL